MHDAAADGSEMMMDTIEAEAELAGVSIPLTLAALAVTVEGERDVEREAEMDKEGGNLVLDSAVAALPSVPEAPHIVGVLDGCTRKMLHVWAWSPSTDDHSVVVEVIINGETIGTYPLDQFRQDLLDGNIGDGRHYLALDVSSAMETYASYPVIEVSVVAVKPARQVIGVRRLTSAWPSPADTARCTLDRLRIMLSVPLRMATGKLAQRNVPGFKKMPLAHMPAAHRTETREAAYEKLFASSEPQATDQDADWPFISTYANFVRYRHRSDKLFEIDIGKAERDNYLRYYLESYGAMRGMTRAPLAPQEITYFNELIRFGGQKFHLSRATYSFLLDNPSLRQGLELNSLDSYCSIIYWWAIQRAKSVFVEDCLVPAAYRDMLADVGSNFAGHTFPPSRFMERYFNLDTGWHFLDLQSAADRMMYYAAHLILATQDPHHLNYIPRTWMLHMINGDTPGETLLGQACAAIFDQADTIFGKMHFGDIMRGRGYDLVAGRSLTRTASGGRVMAASFEEPAAHPDPRHVQIIGPMRKASGLGQAARLSALVLAESGISHSSYDFDMDNPAPVGYANEVGLSTLVAPAVNLIHLNAESIPLSFAYLPDAFKNAYNIGYFFWELDSPAGCHYLSLDLLDEIWVSSQYGVDIYQPHTTKPVINVGMAFEKSPILDKSEARTFLAEKVGIEPTEFVFLAAFDSFSFIQRKNPLGVVRAFKRAFTNNEPVRLLLKTHNKNFVNDPNQLKIWQWLNEEMATDPRIVLLNETLSYDELMKMKQGSDCYVSLHKSEGWGFGMVEAMSVGIPVVATGYSGNLEFCNDDTCWMVDYEMQSLGSDDYIFVVPGQRWALPNVAHAAAQMRSVFSDPALRSRKTKVAMDYVTRRFSVGAVAARYAERIATVLGGAQADPAVVEIAGAKPRRRAKVAVSAE